MDYVVQEFCFLPQEQEQLHVHPEPRATEVEEWMMVCQRNADYQADSNTQQSEFDWTHAYPNLHEMPSFISRQLESTTASAFTTSANPLRLQGKQLQVYDIVRRHLEADAPPPLRMIVSGTAGTGKSYLINCLRLLLKDGLRVAAPTGVAAFNVSGHTLHSLLRLPTKGEFKDLEGETLHTLQQDLANMRYLILDEMSMVGRIMFGQVDLRLRQVFPHHAAPACCLETLDSYHLLWTSPSTPPSTEMQPCQTSVVLPITFSLRLSCSSKSCVSRDMTLPKKCFANFCYGSGMVK